MSQKPNQRLLESLLTEMVQIEESAKEHPRKEAARFGAWNREGIAMGPFLLGLALVLAAPAAHATPVFMGLGQLPGGVQSFATSVSADGSAVVGGGYRAAVPPQEAFRWTSATGLVGLGNLGGLNGSSAADVSADGSVVVGGADVPGSGGRAFRWTSSGGMLALDDLPTDESEGSTATAVSADGSTVVGYGAISLGENSGHEAFRHTADTGTVGLGFLPSGNESQAYSVSGDGSVVVGWSYAFSEELSLVFAEAFLWTPDAGMVGLGDLLGGGIYSIAYDVSPEGSVVVGSSVNSPTGTREPFRWTPEGGMVGLGNLPDGSYVASDAYSVSADGSVVVGWGVDAGAVTYRSFIWDAVHGMRPLDEVLVNDYGLDLTGWSTLLVAAISADGRAIVGSGINPDGVGEAWLAVLDQPVPEPSTALLLVLGLAGFAAKRRPADVSA